jgi:hypothetical protein
MFLFPLPKEVCRISLLISVNLGVAEMAQEEEVLRTVDTVRVFGVWPATAGSPGGERIDVGLL